MLRYSNPLMSSLNLRHPLVMAPMFLVSDYNMIKEAMKAGILGCFPSLNYRSAKDLENTLDSLNRLLDERKGQPGNYGMNLIVQKSNPLLESHLSIAVKHKVPVIITSLGNPKATIDAVHGYGGRVFCDVTNLVHAEKCFQMGCDGFIAVGQGAGGHAGPFPLSLLIDTLKKNFPNVPVLGAGGIADGRAMYSALAAGADLAYCGTRFIASVEAPVSDEYKNAILSSQMGDIVMTDRISGTPCTIINTDYAKKIGTKQNWFEKWMSSNPRTKKYFKMLIQKRGFDWLEKAVKPGSYQTLWCAGQTVEVIDSIQPISEIVQTMMKEFYEADEMFRKRFVSE